MDLEDFIQKDLIAVLMGRWRLFFCLLLACLLLGFSVLWLLPPQYQVTATVIGTRYSSDITPVSQSTRVSVTALLGNGSNDLPDVTDFQLYYHLLTSPELGASILNDPVMHRVFETQWYDGRWGPPDTLWYAIKAPLLSVLGRATWTAPDGYDVANYLTKHLEITASKDSKMLTLTVWNVDPELGKQLITLVNRQADSMVRQMAQKRLRDKVEYLRNEIAQTTVQEVRQVLGLTLARAQVDYLYSRTDLPFAAEFLAAPRAPDKPDFPNIPQVLAMAAAAAMIIYFLDILMIAKLGKAPLYSIYNWLFACRNRRAKAVDASLGDPRKSQS